MEDKYIQSFVVNLKRRTDRRTHIIDQFASRKEFQMNLIKAFEHPVGAIGLWNTIRHILKDMVDMNDEYIILCQDDHLFTKEYSKEYLFYCINEAQSLHADILACGVSGFTSAIPISEHIFWVEKFSGLQFAVVFRKFFQKILDTDFENINAADLKLCELTENKFFIFPFLSVQKEFGYSDVTPGNNAQGYIDKGFKDSDEKVTILKSISTFYKQKLRATELLEIPVSPESIVIPTYIIYLNEKTECLRNIEKQFTGKEEFNVSVIEVCHHKVKELSIWLSLKKIIETAIKNDDDVIIICREDHQFTEYYEAGYFIPLVWKAGLLGCNVLIGGMDAFNLALPITDDIFWIDSFHSSNFFVIYRVFFESILQVTFSDSDTLESKFSEMTSKKMALHPFISEEKSFEDVSMNNLRNINIQHPNSNERLLAIKNACKKFKKSNRRATLI